jgi:sulfate/thiosulfate transport system permease protein
MSDVNRRVLPGFRAGLSLTTGYLLLLVVLPLMACLAKACSLSPSQFLAAVWTERARSAYVLTFGCAAVAAALNVLLGLIIAWVLVRYEFPLKRIFDSLIDLPLALPTAVAGLVYSNLYGKHGWLGRYLVPMGVQVAYTRLGIIVVLTFIGLPFVVRAVEPVLAAIDAEVEEAAAILGATRWQSFYRVILPTLFPALLTGFVLALARAIGEYGSVVFISSNVPGRTEIAPVLIVARLEEVAYADATAIAVVLLAASFALLGLINFLESWSTRRAT